MNNNDWKTEEKPATGEPCSYQTGNTHPPKNYRGIITVLLVLVIFLGGIVSALSLWNIHLFKMIIEDNAQDTSFRFVPEKTQEKTASQDNPKVQLPLTKTPSQKKVPSLQEVYDQTAHSLVSITTDASVGLGVLISQDGYLIANGQLVENAETLEIQLPDGKTLPATVIGTDLVSNLAVLHIAETNCTPAQFGKLPQLQAGSQILTLDSLLQWNVKEDELFEITSSTDISGHNVTYMQTTTTLPLGSLLLNRHGQIVGIFTKDTANKTYALDSNSVKTVVDQLLANGYVSGRPSLGLKGRNISSFNRQYYQIPQGVYITEVSPNSASAKAGILPGDILIALNGNQTPTVPVLKKHLYSYAPGDTVNLLISRNGKEKTLAVCLEAFA